MNSLKAMFAFGAALAAASSGSAAILTVDDSGGANYTTLGAAITAAASGDTIIVKDGSYTQAASVTISKKLRIIGPNANVSPVTNLGQRGPEAVIQLNGSPGLILQSTAANGTELIGLKIRGVNTTTATNSLIQVRGTGGSQASTEYSAPSGIVLRRVFFENTATKFYSVGNGAASGANDWVVEDNLFKDWGANGGSADTAIFHTNSYNLTFRNNRFVNSTANGDDRALNFVNLFDSVITGNIIDQTYVGANFATASTQLGQGSKRNTVTNNYFIGGATGVAVYPGTDNAVVANFTTATLMTSHPKYQAGDGANQINEGNIVRDNLIVNAKSNALDLIASGDRDDMRNITVTGNTIRQDVGQYRASAANTGIDAVRIVGQNGIGGTDTNSAIIDNVTLSENSVRFSGSAFGDGNVVSYYGIRVRNRVEDILVENNTITGVPVTSSTSALIGNFPPSAGFYLTTTQFTTSTQVANQAIDISLPASANIQFNQNTINGFPNSATLVGFGPSTTLVPTFGDLPASGQITFALNDLGSPTYRQVLSGAVGAQLNADSNFWNTPTPQSGVNFEGNVSVNTPLASGRTPALGAVTPSSGSNVTFADTDIRGGAASTATISIQNAGTAAIAVTALNITGANAGDFFAGLPLDIAGGTTRNFTISFRPTASGARTANLAIVTDQGTQNFTLNGTAVASGSTLDTDGDGLSDVYENLNGTNPNLRDTDGDGLEDGVEVAIGTNPNATTTYTDADGDKLPDNGGIDPNPASADSDGDKYRDGYEVAVGTDPNNASSKPSLGDVNGGGLDFSDGIAMLRVFLGLQNINTLSNPNAFDVNRDGFKDNADASIVINVFLGNITALPFPQN